MVSAWAPPLNLYTGGRVCTVGCTARSAQSRQAEMGLSKAQEQQAVANAKNEIAAFSDMYNRCERAARVTGRPQRVLTCACARPAGWSSSASRSASRAFTTRSSLSARTRASTGQQAARRSAPRTGTSRPAGWVGVASAGLVASIVAAQPPAANICSCTAMSGASTSMSRRSRRWARPCRRSPRK